jgi:hypothetical protein
MPGKFQGAIRFDTNSSLTPSGNFTPQERLRITSAGLVGIGTSAPVNLLHVQGDATFEQNAGGQFAIRGSTNSSNRFNFGFDTTSNYAWLQAITAGTAYRPIALNPAGGYVGIGTASPNRLLEIAGSGGASNVEFRLNATDGGERQITFIGTGSTSQIIKSTGTTDNSLVIIQGSNERARIDSSGRLLVGTSTGVVYPVSNAYAVQSAGTSSAAGFAASRWSANTGATAFALAKSRGANVGTRGAVLSGDSLGLVTYSGDDGTNFVEAARIQAQVDGTPDADVMPGRLVFSTTANGSSSPAERMRIKSSGIINFSNAPVYADNTAALAGGLVAGDVYRKYGALHGGRDRVHCALHRQR